MKRLTAQSGYSLVELVLVAFVAGLSIMVLANIVPAMNLVSSSSRENIARQIAARRLEDVRAQGYDNLANGISNYSDPRLTALSQSSATTKIEDCPTSICTNNEPIKSVTIQVSWVENNKAKDFSLTTLVSKGGIK